MLDVFFVMAEGFSSSLDVLYGGLWISKLQILVNCIFLVIKTLDPGPDSLEMLDPNPDSVIRRHNTAACSKRTRLKLPVDPAELPITFLVGSAKLLLALHFNFRYLQYRYRSRNRY